MGECTKEKVKEWIKRLKTTLGDKFDKDNLKLLGHAVRNLMGPTLLAWVVSLTGPDAIGPELFLAALHQVSYMTAALVKSVCNKMGALKLKSIPGENISDSCETISKMIKQIESSGKPPSDLLNSVSKPFTTGTQETFRLCSTDSHRDCCWKVHRR